MQTDALLARMIDYDAGDPRRIQHFIKVHAFAAHIGRCEGLDPRTQEILEAAALVHDIGIREAERQFGSSNGKLQERLGPPIAADMLRGLGYDEGIVERVACLVGRHHTYEAIDGIDCQILIEADFLVNLAEGGADAAAIRDTYARIFRTARGRALCRALFALPD